MSQPLRDRRDVLETRACRYGKLTFPRFDTTIGKSLEFYGEWAQKEIDLLWELIPKAGTVVDVGAYVGTHTVAFSRRVGAKGSVVSIEPGPTIFPLLEENVRQNALLNVQMLQCAMDRENGILVFPQADLASSGNFGASEARGAEGASNGTNGVEVAARTLDDLGLDRVDLIKIDSEGMESAVLEGAERVISRLRPLLHLECRSVSQGQVLLARLTAAAYRVYAHRPMAFNPANFRRSTRILFGRERELSLLAIPMERLAGLESVLEAHLATPVGSVDELSPLFSEPTRSLAPERRDTPSNREAHCSIDVVNGIPYDSLGVSEGGARLIPREDEGFFATGWAIAQGEPAGGLLVEVAQETLQTDFGFAREDVAALFGDRRYARSGFAFSLPPDLVVRGPLRLRMVVLALDQSRRFELPPLHFLVE